MQRNLSEATLRANIAADIWDAEAWQQLAGLLLQSKGSEHAEAQRAFFDRLLSMYPTSVSSVLLQAGTAICLVGQITAAST